MSSLTMAPGGIRPNRNPHLPEHAKSEIASDHDPELEPKRGLGEIILIIGWLTPGVPIFVTFGLVIQVHYGPYAWYASKAAIAFLVAATVLASGHQAPRARLALSIAFLGAATFALAYPGGRHPFIMGMAVLMGGVMAFSALWDARSMSPGRVAPVLVVCMGVFLLGISPLPLRLEIAIASPAMNEQAKAALAESGHVETTLRFDPQHKYACRHPEGDECGSVGPFPYRASYTDERGATVSYTLGGTLFGLDSKEQAGLIYSPGVIPTPAQPCLNHLVGDWYEAYSWRKFDGSCPAGLSPEP